MSNLAYGCLIDFVAVLLRKERGERDCGCVVRGVGVGVGGDTKSVEIEQFLDY